MAAVDAGLPRNGTLATVGFPLKELSAFWDRHFFLPVLEWLSTKFSAMGNQKCKDEVDNLYIEILRSTCMKKKIEKMLNKLNKSLSEEKNNEFSMRCEKYKEEIKKLEMESFSFFKAIISFRKSQQTRLSGNIERRNCEELLEWWMKQKPQVTSSMTDEEKTQIKNDYYAFPTNAADGVIRLAKLLCECGRYSQTKKILHLYLKLVAEHTYEGMLTSKKETCYWGIACSGLQDLLFNSMADYSQSSADYLESRIYQIKPEDEDTKEVDVLESMEPEVVCHCILRLNELAEISDEVRTANRGSLVIKRAWLLCWFLFLLFKHYLYSTHVHSHVPTSNVWGHILDWFMDSRSLGLTHISNPYLLRYYAVYAILNKKRKDHFQLILDAIVDCKGKYTDTFTSLLESLLLNFDFNAAEKHIANVEKSCDDDYFLSDLSSVMVEHCRLLVFETYCRIHNSINIDMIARKLNLSPDDAEKWIVNLISNAKLEAKIDSEKNVVEMSANLVSVHQQVIDKTKDIALRTNMLCQSLLRAPQYGFFKTTDDYKQADRDYKHDHYSKNVYAGRNQGRKPEIKDRIRR